MEGSAVEQVIDEPQDVVVVRLSSGRVVALSRRALAQLLLAADPPTPPSLPEIKQDAAAE